MWGKKLAVSGYDSLLRYNREPSRNWDDREIHDVLTRSPREYLEFVYQGLQALASGRALVEQPPKQIFDDESGGDFRVMPCVTRRDGEICKTVKVVGTNLAQQKVPDKITVGKLLVLDPVENFAAHIMDACALSSARTGICAAVAVLALQGGRRETGVVGCGRVGFYSALYLCALGGVEHLWFLDTQPDRADAMAAAMKALYPQIRFSSCKLIQPADLLILASTSLSPLVHPAETDARLVISLGADTDYQRELDPAWQQEARLFVESLDSLRYGDLKHWGVARSEVTELSEVIGGGDPPASGRSVFISTGSAVYDNLTVAYMLRSIDTLIVDH